MAANIVDIGEIPALLGPRERVLGLDLGEKTIGLALSDSALTLASPLETIQRRKFTPDVEALKAIIAERNDDFSRNLVERLLAYSLCRSLEGYDEIVVDDLMRDIARDGYRMQTLITAVVTSYPFTHRRIQTERTPK